MPLNHYVTLGRSGLRVSPMCLGAMTFGEDLGFGASEEVSRGLIDRFLDAGGNFIDTANVYTRGHSEKILGDHLGAHPSRRQRTVIATKFMGNLIPGDPNGGGTGRKAMMAALDESLRRLRTDYVDLYWLHVWDRHTPIEETMRALDDVIRAGKVRYIGLSDTPAWKVAQAQMLAEMKGWSTLVGLQIEYSLVERTVEGELIPMAREMGLGVTPWSPLKGGVLTGKYTRDGSKKADRGASVERALNDRTFGIVDEVVRIAKELSTTPARVALAWVMGRPGVASTIIGARTPDQLEQNLGALDVKLRAEDVDALNKVSKPVLNFPAAMVEGAGVFSHGGITINGVTPPVWPAAPKTDSERY